LLPFIRKVAVAGVALAALAACTAPAHAKPVWAGATQDATADPTQAAPLPTPSAKATPKVTAEAKITYTFPVVGQSSYARSHHDYPASDIMTACGHKFVAVTSGVVLTATKKDTWSRKVNAGATRGGLSVAIKGDDGVRYYGSHLSSVDAAIKPGARVKTGQTLGKTGDTGDASACHLHFGISPPCAQTGDWWNQRGTIWPWRYLDSWRSGGQKSAVAEAKAWQKANGCPKKPQVDA
jgi:murein DD-endopeptidase MepM/ murein hydrolase activator NlpD